ncbi:MAG: hypothetical protein P8189_07275 [Anaerolineae bacterium]|jgi:hypothetical protein
MSLSAFARVRKSIDLLCQATKQYLRRWAKPDNHDLALNPAMDLTRSKRELVLENMLLRQQTAELIISHPYWAACITITSGGRGGNHRIPEPLER